MDLKKETDLLLKWTSSVEQKTPAHAVQIEHTVPNTQALEVATSTPTFFSGWYGLDLDAFWQFQ